MNSARRGRAGRAAVLTLSALLLACGPREPAPPAPPPKIEPPPPQAPKLITPPPPAASRADLLAAAAAAASAYAAGTAPQGSDPLAGRTFTIRSAFGCLGPAREGRPAAGLAGWAPRAKDAAVELSLTPADWSASPLFAQAIEARLWDGAEGYWIDRPWLAAETCPAGPAEPSETPSPQTVGLAAVFEPQGSRFGRRKGRAYGFTLRGTGEAPPALPAKGFRLVLEGRFATFPDGRTIQCRADGPDQRPLCVAAATLDRVAFEDGDTGGQISEWRKD
ncbi:hypothetical protein [Phenylobacterium sp.]|uniref:hypothetical protein n=1 Tax=Phenylobacterium sp. TaxID=1871053 RepID=UPI00289780A3|nr:hypothetical protein [Phenylobacterium sp.]